MKMIKFKTLILFVTISYISSCSNPVDSFNGHWHLVSDSSTIKSYYLTLNITDSVAILNKYDISRNLYEKKNLLIENGIKYLKNELFYMYYLSLSGDTLIVENDIVRTKWLKYENTFNDQLNDAFSSIFLNIELDVSSNITPIDSIINHVSIINIGRAKNGFPTNNLNSYDGFLIQCKDQICKIEDVEDFLMSEYEIQFDRTDGLSVLINADNNTPNDLLNNVINKVGLNNYVNKIYRSYKNEKQQFIGIKEIKK